MPTVPYHRGYRNYNVAFFTRTSPCINADCYVCYPGWSLTAAQLIDRKQRAIELLRIERNYREIELHRANLNARNETRAHELLLSFLDDEQREDYRRNDRFTIVGSDGDRYVISRGYSGNIKLEDGRRRCAHPEMEAPITDHRLGEMYMELPDEDAMVAQMLMLMTDAPAFHDVAYSA